MLYYTLYLGHLEDRDTNQNVLVSNHDDHADHADHADPGVDHVTDATDGVHPPAGVHHVLPVKKRVHLLLLGKHAKHCKHILRDNSKDCKHI